MVTKILVIFGPAYHKIILKLLRKFQASIFIVWWVVAATDRQTDRQTLPFILQISFQASKLLALESLPPHKFTFCHIVITEYRKLESTAMRW